MNLDDARKVLAIIRTADGGCGVCVRSLLELCEDAFPELLWPTFDEDEYEVVGDVEERKDD